MWFLTEFANWKDGIEKIVHEFAHVAACVKKLKGKRLRGMVRLSLHCSIFRHEEAICGNINILLPARILIRLLKAVQRGKEKKKREKKVATKSWFDEISNGLYYVKGTITILSFCRSFSTEKAKGGLLILAMETS